MSYVIVIVLIVLFSSQSSHTVSIPDLSMDYLEMISFLSSNPFVLLFLIIGTFYVLVSWSNYRSNRRPV